MTPRQSKLLKAIIDEFISNAEAVGSVSLANKYNLGVSPATIRNEMADLVEQGYLEKPHSSSGRVPTNLGFKYFIDQLLRELDDLEHTRSVRIKENLFQNRFETSKLLRTALNTLAEESATLALATFGDDVWYAGFSNLILKPDYETKEELATIMDILEDVSMLQEVLESYSHKKTVRVLVGEDTGIKGLSTTAFLFKPVQMHGGRNGYLGLVGPNRMNYARNIPLLDFVATHLTSVISGW